MKDDTSGSLPAWYVAAQTRNEPEYNPDTDIRRGRTRKTPLEGWKLKSLDPTYTKDPRELPPFRLRWIPLGFLWLGTLPFSLIVWPGYPLFRRWYNNRINDKV